MVPWNHALGTGENHKYLCCRLLPQKLLKTVKFELLIKIKIEQTKIHIDEQVVALTTEFTTLLTNQITRIAHCRRPSVARRQIIMLAITN